MGKRSISKQFIWECFSVCVWGGVVSVLLCLNFFTTIIHTLSLAAFCSAQLEAGLPALALEDPRMDINKEGSLPMCGKVQKALAYNIGPIPMESTHFSHSLQIPYTLPSLLVETFTPTILTLMSRWHLSAFPKDIFLNEKAQFKETETKYFLQVHYKTVSTLWSPLSLKKSYVYKKTEKRHLVSPPAYPASTSQFINVHQIYFILGTVS